MRWLLLSHLIRIYTVGPLALGWSCGAKVLGKLSMPGHPTNLDNACSRTRPIALAVVRVGVVWTFFSLVYLFSFFLLETT